MQFSFMGYYVGLVQRHPYNRFLVKSDFILLATLKILKIMTITTTR